MSVWATGPCGWLIQEITQATWQNAVLPNDGNVLGSDW